MIFWQLMTRIIYVIELKYTRDNEVKRQTLEFEKVVKYENEFFYQLVKLYTDKEWNGSIRKISVLPKAEGKTRKKEYIEVEEINYSTNEEKQFIHLNKAQCNLEIKKG